MNVLLWIVGIAFAAFLGIGAVQLIAFGEVRAKTVENSYDIEKIRGDYMPYFAVQYIVESNNKLFNLLTAIESKDDRRYQEAMKDWQKLQQEVVRNAGINKRSGGTSSISGGQ